jgi:excisionase family DNA binding protein
MVAAPDTTVAAADRFLTLQETAAELRVCAKTLAEPLKAHPADPPLYACPALAADPAVFVRPSARVIRVMELLDVDESTVRRLIDRGEIEAHGVGKRGIRVYLDSVRGYQDARAVPPKGGKPKLKAQRSDVARAAHRGAEAALRKSGIIP